jgi:hypothetical protein
MVILSCSLCLFPNTQSVQHKPVLSSRMNYNSFWPLDRGANKPLLLFFAREDSMDDLPNNISASFPKLMSLKN